MKAHVTIEAIWEEGGWLVHIDRTNRNSGFVGAHGLEAALQKAIPVALENFKYRRDKAGEKLEGAL